MKNHHIRALRPLIHCCIIILAFWASYQLRQYTDLIPSIQVRIPPFIISELVLFATIATVIYVIIGLRYKIFQLQGLVLGYYSRFVQTILHRSIIITGLAYFGNGFIFHGGISRFVIIVTTILAFITITIIDPIYERMMSWMGRSYRLAIINTSPQDTQEAVRLIHHTIDAHIDEYKYEQVPNSINQYDTIILLGPLELQKIQTLADSITISGKEFFHVHSAMFLDDLIFEQQQLGPLLGLQYKSSTIDERSSVIKRIFDIVGSLLGLIILSPLMIRVAYRIKQEDNGPIFFIQRRVGLGGREFNFFKFRSMKLEYCTGPGYGGPKADQYYEQLIKSDLNTRPGSMPKIHHDPRVTTIGQRIRAKSLDELPQLCNVLLGTMSLIGPRPHLPREVMQYEGRQRRLFAVKPGITGYAQIFGRDTLDFKEEARLDLYYIQHWSIFMDIYVLFATLGVISKGR